MTNFPSESIMGVNLKELRVKRCFVFVVRGRVKNQYPSPKTAVVGPALAETEKGKAA